MNHPLALALILALAWTSAVLAQNTVRKHVSTSSSTGVSVSTVNGQTTVLFNGQQVFAGPSRGPVTARSSNVNGVEYAAVYDGNTVIWENVPGAAQQLKSTNVRQKQATAKHVVRQVKPGGSAGGGAAGGGGGSAGGGLGSSASISVKSINGDTVVVYQGREIKVGQTSGRVAAKVKSVNGTEYAAAFDGDRVIWENVPGAADKLR